MIRIRELCYDDIMVFNRYTNEDSLRCLFCNNNIDEGDFMVIFPDKAAVILICNNCMTKVIENLLKTIYKDQP